MTSKIISMVERLKDSDELKLEALFRNDPIPDDGFSRRVVVRVRRRLWIRRLTMPVAVLIGGLIAAKPASDLLLAAYRLVSVLPDELTKVPMPSLSAESLPQFSAALVGIVLVTAGVLFVRTLED